MNFALIALSILIASQSEFPASAVLAIAKRLAESPQVGQSYCLSVDGKNLSVALLEGVKSHLSSVVPDSECSTSNNQVSHVPSGNSAVRVYLSRFQELDATRAHASMQTYAGPLAGGRWSVKLKLAGKQWVVEALENELIY